MICEMGLNVVYLLLFLPNNLAGLGVCSKDLIPVGLTPRRRLRGVEMVYEQMPAKAHAPLGARATLVV